MRCDDLEPLIEAIADGLAAAVRGGRGPRRVVRDLRSARIERARSIESLLSMREVAAAAGGVHAGA